MNILVVNCGSSSVKYRLFSDSLERARGLIERVGSAETPNHTVAVRQMFEQISHIDGGLPIEEIHAIGHRVVHGGEAFTGSVVITPQVIEAVEACATLAPLHNPPNLLGIRACMEQAPQAIQVAVFDTAFHHTLPPRAYLYALPYELREKYGIRRYGFHGTSHRYVSERVIERLKQENALQTPSKVICCHLGNGSSITAVLDGESVDTSMGMTPAEGLVMGTRSGDIDPAIILHLQRTLGWDADRVDRLINKEGGLLALAGVSDMRDVEARAQAGDRKAQTAFEVFCYRVIKYIGAYAAAMNGVHAIAFTAGIGENSSAVRSRVCASLEYLGVRIDETANREGRGERCISTPDSPVKVYVVPTDEERVIAAETRKLAEQMRR
ncbi:MAG: acetate/propionate family kinase [Armatimonadota bacterium]